MSSSQSKIAAVLFLLSSCQEKDSGKNESIADPATVQVEVRPLQQSPACSSGTAIPEIADSFSALLATVCSANVWNDITSEANLYRDPKATPYVRIQGIQTTNQNETEATSAGSMIAPVAAEEYVAMLRMRVGFPIEFKANGFLVDSKLSIASQEFASTYVRYEYHLNGEDVDSAYVAKAEFIPAGPEKVFFIATRALDEYAMKTVRFYRALIIVDTLSDTSCRVTGISTARIDNSGNHSSAMTQLSKRFAKDSTLALKNSPMARKALDFLSQRISQ